MGTVAHESPTARATTSLRSAAWVRAAPLACLVSVSFVVRALLAGLRPAPRYFPDEYIYAALGRSIASGGKPEVHGAAAHFPALLQPLLTAPAWLVGDIATSYRLVQAIAALAMSLAAIPVYLLGRRLGLGRGLALGVAGLAVTVPDMLYAGWVLSEPFGYPLALASILVGTLALARPGRRNQLGFVALALLASFARLQLAILFPAFVGAAAVVGLRERRLRTVAREQLVPLSVVGVLGLGAVARAAGGLGFYSGALHPHLHLPDVATSAGADLLVLGYAAGWALVPGSLLGLYFALARPRSRLELSFGAFAAVFGGLLLLQAATWGEPDLVRERYLFYVLPLAALAFGLYAARGWPARRAHALLASVFVAVAALVPLSGYAVGSGKDHSALLFGLSELIRFTSDASGSLVFAAAAAALLLAAVAASVRPTTGTPILVGLVLAATAGVGGSAVAFDAASSRAAAATHLAPDRSWVDHAGLGPVTFLRSPGAQGHRGIEQLFWNRSVERVALLPHADRLDAFANARLSVGRDGTIREAGQELRGPLLVDETASTVLLRGGRVVSRTRLYSLWRPTGAARLALEFRGRYADGWVAQTAAIELWPARPGESIDGRLMVHLRASARPNTIRLRVAGGQSRTIRLAAGAATDVTMAVCSSGPATIDLDATKPTFLGDRVVSVRSSVPVFRADAAACPTRSA